MSSCFDPWRTGAVTLDASLVSFGTPAAVQQRQRHRLAALLGAATRGSAFYRERLRGVSVDSLGPMPPVHKRELMDDFGAWVADPRLKLPALRAFVADPSNIGRAFAGDFVVWESSGSSGEPGIFVQDARAMAVYDALEACRRTVRWPDPWYLGERIAFVGATTGHFASTVSIERLRRLHPAMASALHGFSFLQPTAALVEQLNGHAPTVVATYPSAAVLLAEEAAAGRLRVALNAVWTGGETLTPGMRRFVETRFGCPVTNSYGASEFLPLAWQCARGALHLNADWVILEPVDERGRPVPPGTAGATTLLTNLANHVQPLIRYDVGDRVVLHERACACGSPLPVLDVQGRSDDMLVMEGDEGPVRLLPLALSTVLEDEGHVFDFQLVQTAARALRLAVGGDGRAAARARQALARYLQAQGLAGVRIEARGGAARVRGRTGKLKRIIAAAASRHAARAPAAGAAGTRRASGRARGRVAGRQGAR